MFERFGPFGERIKLAFIYLIKTAKTVSCSTEQAEAKLHYSSESYRSNTSTGLTALQKQSSTSQFKFIIKCADLPILS